MQKNLINAEEIKKAVDEGHKVFCDTKGYEVVKSTKGDYSINFINSDYFIGLTWKDGQTLNGSKFWYDIAELTEEQEQDINDLCCRITDELVDYGLIKDCTDKISQDEWDAQDIIFKHIKKFLNK